MDKAEKRNDKSSWAIGGGLLIGMGIGFFFLKQNSLAFVGSMFLGLGFGLLVSAILSRIKS